jgi:hypothetical protein
LLFRQNYSVGLALGFVEENGCVLLASEAHASGVARNAGEDDTGYECFVNHLHITSLAEAVEFARRLESALAVRFADSFIVIVSFDGREAIVRFHKSRAGQRWLASNLEEYVDEGIAVLNSE